MNVSGRGRTLGPNRSDTCIICDVRTRCESSPSEEVVMLRRVSLRVMARLKTILLLAIVFLLALNLVFPTRYTLKLVPVTSQDDTFDTRLPSREVKQVEPSHVSAVLTKANGTERATTSTRKATVQPSTEGSNHFLVQNPRERRPVHNVRWVEAPRERDWVKEEDAPMVGDVAGWHHFMWQEEEEREDYKAKHGSRLPSEEMKNLLQKWRSAGYKDSEFDDVFGGILSDQEHRGNDRPDPRRVNFHDPVQRMKYYKALRNKYADPALRRRGMGKASMFHKVVDSMWGGWFEGDGEGKM